MVAAIAKAPNSCTFRDGMDAFLQQLPQGVEILGQFKHQNEKR